jgi:NDP-sugar pyrophosphorylase family protein
VQCVVLAGGMGTRIAQVAPDLPKALIPVHGEPFAHHQLSLLARGGIDRVVYCIGHRGGAIRDFAGSGGRWGLEVSYVDEGADLRGTGGALRLALDLGVLDDRFFVLYGDSYLPIDYRAVWASFESRPGAALMTVLRNQERWDASNAIFESGKVLLYDKRAAAPRDPRLVYIDYGLSILRRATVERYVAKGQKADLADAWNRMSIAGELLGFEVTERFYEIGSPSGLQDFARYVAETAASDRR